MSDERRKDALWRVRANADGTLPWEAIKVAVLMDLRDELKALNRLLRCRNFLDIPNKLDRIHRKLPTRKPRKPKP